MATMEKRKYRTTGQYELDYDVFYPDQRSEKMPALVLIFGGSWIRGSRTRFYPWAEHFTQKGYVVITPDYRVFERQRVSPRECVEDGINFWRHINENAESEFGVNPQRIALGGGSAGGHVAIMSGLKTGIYPKAYVLYNPVVSTSSPVFWNTLLTKERHQFPPLKDDGLTYENFNDIDPMEQLGGYFSPAIFIHGRLDDKVPVEQLEQFAAKVKALGTAPEVYIYEGVGHGFFNKDRSVKYFEETCSKVEAFLEKYL